MLDFKGIFNVLVYLQVFFFTLSYHLRIKIDRNILPFISIAWLDLVLSMFLYMFLHDVKIGFYDCWLILFYGIEVVLFLYLFNQEEDRTLIKSISLSFLVTFLSSYFWEFPLHLTDLLTLNITPNFFLQATHLIPLIALNWEYEIKKPRKLVNYLLFSWILTLLITALRLEMLMNTPLNKPLQYLNRILSLLILIKILFKDDILSKKHLKSRLNNVNHVFNESRPENKSRHNNASKSDL